MQPLGGNRLLYFVMSKDGTMFICQYISGVLEMAGRGALSSKPAIVQVVSISFNKIFDQQTDLSCLFNKCQV